MKVGDSHPRPGDLRMKEISVMLYGPQQARATSHRYLLTYHIAFVSALCGASMPLLCRAPYQAVMRDGGRQQLRVTRTGPVANG